MKKLSFKVFLVLAMLVTTISCSVERQAMNSNRNLIGTWQLCNKTDSLIQTDRYGDKGMISQKIISSDSFTLADIQKNEKNVLGTIIGPYTVNKNIYTEFCQYTDFRYRNHFGEKNSFKYKIENDLMFIKGINNEVDEIWKKVKENN